MATVIGIKLDDRRELVAEAMENPQALAQGRPLFVRRVLALRRQGGRTIAEPWIETGDLDQPVYLQPAQVRSVHSPRKDALTRFKRFWDRHGRAARLQTSLPKIAMAEICQFDEPILVREPAYQPGNVSAVELIVLNHLVRRATPAVCFEIGTFDGRTTLNLASNTGPECRIFTLDLPAAQLDGTAYEVAAGERQFIEKAASGSRFTGTPQASKIEQLYGDSANFDFSPYHGVIDFVFVDASHVRDYVLNDAGVAMNLLRRGTNDDPRGTVVFHDYGEWEGVTEALEELHRGDPRFSGLSHVEDTTLAVLTL